MNIYSTFYHAPKPQGIESRKAYIVGGGIAGLAAAAFLIDDAHMPGGNITIYERRKDVGGCCGVEHNAGAYICPGERELEPNMECLWYLCSKIPSLDTPERTVLDETVDANKERPIHSECRCIQNQGHIWEGVHDFQMPLDTMMKLAKFLAEPEKNLENLTIEDYFGKDSDLFDSAMWWCFHTMLAFKPYHSALEAKRYLSRFGLANRIDYLEGILHTKRNEYDSIIKPLLVWLQGKGVHFSYERAVYDLEMDDACNTVYGIRMTAAGKEERVSVRPEDYVFVTTGSMMTNAAFGDNMHIAKTNRDENDLGLFTIWKNLARKNEKFGHPEKFLGKIDQTKWMSFFVTVKDYPAFFDRMERMTGSPRGTSGCLTIKDSGWNMSVFVYDRAYFPDQEKNDEDVLWGYGLFGERKGDYIQKPMGECTGEEVLLELLYHLDMLDMKDEVLAHTHISTCMMPYITAHFMPRSGKDRPRIVPKGCTNLALMGQYVEVPGDVAFTIETSVRTPLEAVYTLTGLDREIIEVYPSQYDLRYFVERFKKFTGIKGEMTEDMLPDLDPVQLTEQMPVLKHELVERFNHVPPYYVLYPGRDKSIAQKAAVLHPQYPKDK